MGVGVKDGGVGEWVGGVNVLPYSAALQLQ